RNFLWLAFLLSTLRTDMDILLFFLVLRFFTTQLFTQIIKQVVNDETKVIHFVARIITRDTSTRTIFTNNIFYIFTIAFTNRQYVMDTLLDISFLLKKERDVRHYKYYANELIQKVTTGR
ncbi:hypothetical protein ACJX0J_025207, partial [Zea mays]